MPPKVTAYLAAQDNPLQFQPVTPPELFPKCLSFQKHWSEQWLLGLALRALHVSTCDNLAQVFTGFQCGHLSLNAVGVLTLATKP